MLLTLACLFTAAAAAPLTYDQRQDGDFNVAADIQNIVFVVAYPTDIFEGFFRNKPHSRNSNAQERADHMEAFVEPNTPYKVEIGERLGGNDGRAAEVVIVSRKKTGAETEAEPENEADELKLIGATEQCGPDRERDPVTLACRWRADAAPQPDAVPKPDAAPQPEAAPKPEAAPLPEAASKPEQSPKPDTALKPEAAPQPAAASKDSEPSKDKVTPKSPEPTPEVVSS